MRDFSILRFVDAPRAVRRALARSDFRLFLEDLL